jgi:hypothetical protein
MADTGRLWAGGGLVDLLRRTCDEVTVAVLPTGLPTRDPAGPPGGHHQVPCGAPRGGGWW